MSEHLVTGERRRVRLDTLARSVARPWPDWLSWMALGALLIAAGAVLAYETRGTLFWADEWQWIMTRRGGGVGTFLDPHNEHLSLLPVALYKILFATVGLRHYWPYRGLLIAVELITGTLVFVYAKRSVGAYYALLAAALILFFGPGWQDILWPFQVAWVLVVATGVGALLALDRRDRAGDVAACVLLCMCLASSSPGLAVAAGVIVELLLRRRPRDVWIVAVPLALYALWWIGYQQAQFNSNSILLLPRFVFDAAAGALSSLAGLAQVNVFNDEGGDFLSWGAPLLVVGLAALAWRLGRLGRVPPRVVTIAVILLAFWLLTGIGRAYFLIGPIGFGSTGDESRYLYVGAAFVVLLVVELARTRASVRPWLAVGVGVLAVSAIVSNLGPLRAGAGLLRAQAQYTEAELGTMNISRNIIDPGYVSNGLVFEIVTAKEWFAAERALGSPPLSPQLLATQPQFAASAADAQLIKIQRLALRPLGAAGEATGAIAPPVDVVQGGTISTRGPCVGFRPAAFTSAGAPNALQLTIRPGAVAIDAGIQPATVSVRRFASTFTDLGTLAPGAHGSLTVAPDLAPEPWHLEVSSGSAFVVCGLG